jgi:hypothetical protein
MLSEQRGVVVPRYSGITQDTDWFNDGEEEAEVSEQNIDSEQPHNGGGSVQSA